MAEQLNTLVQIITSLAQALKPLIEASKSTEGLMALLDEVGANPSMDLSLAEQKKLRVALELTLEPFTNPTDIVEIIRNLPNVTNTFSNNLPSALADVGERLLDSLIVTQLQREAPLAFSILVIVGVISLELLPPSKLSGRPRSRWIVKWGLIPNLFSDPGDLFETVYGWGTDDFDPVSLLRNLRNVFLLAGAPASFQKNDQEGLRAASSANMAILRVPILVHDHGDSSIEAGLAFLATRDPDNTHFDGLALAPFGFVDLSTKVDIGKNWSLSSKGSLKVQGGVGLVIKSGGHLSIKLLNGSDSSDATIDLSVGIAQNSSIGPVILFGDADSSRLEVGSVGIKGQAEIRLKGNSEFRLESHIHSGRLIVNTNGSDGFLSKVLSDDIEAPFEIVIGWSNLRGVYFSGSAGLEIAMPIHANLGPLKLEVLHIGAFFQTPTLLLQFQLGVDVGVELGPFSASISRIGVKLDVSISRTPDFALSFLPPKGAGLSIDGAVTGGGFLDFDHENKRYTGILTLKCGEIGITAIGLITTKMPDGSKGFSMLVNIGVTFKPPIQLSMGFTLSGVGGIIGVNRTIMIDVLRAGVKKHTLDSILFPEPEWVIPNAAKVISDLRAVFPPADGRFVIGPMVKIGYGSPNIIIADIGVFIELPKPIRIVLLGQLSMLLPDPKKAIVRINLDIVGVLDMEKKELSFQASLYDSGILKFELYGDAAFFLGWGAQPEFAMSLGGFHPRFEPPPPPIVFADLKRLGLNLSSGSNFQLSCGVYQALTPNSLQFGARADLYATACGAEITGFLSFDTLIYFSPFSFEIDLGAGVAIRFKGIDLAEIRVALNLSGPTPWNARGTATIKILFFDLDVKFHITWGREDAARPDPIDPWPQLEQALLRAESWGSLLPVAANMVESLRKIEEEPVEVADGEEPKPAPVIVHPAGTLEIRQNIAPLNCTLKKFGNAPVCKHDRFRITSLTTSDGASLGDESLDEFFSRGQFEKLSNSQKLSVPSFEKMPGGVKTKSSNRIVVQGQVRSEELCYESIVIKSDRTSARPKTLSDSKMAVSAWRNSRVLTAGNAYSRSALRNKGKSRFALKGGRLVKTAQEKYVIVDTDTLQTVTIDQKADIWSEKMTRTQAEQALAQHLTISSKEAQSLIVISEYEAEEVA